MPSTAFKNGDETNNNQLSSDAVTFDSPSIDAYPYIKEIRELRQRLAETLKQWPEYDTVYSLQRWLQSQQYNVDATVPLVESGLKTIALLGCFDYSYENPENVSKTICSMILTAPYFPGGIMGFDKNGNVVPIQPLGRVRPKSLMTTGRVSDLYRISILECEGIMQLLRREEMRRQQKLGVIVIYDITEYSTAMITTSSMKVFSNNLFK